MNIPETLSKCRELSGLTAQDLAGILYPNGKYHNVITHYETGRRIAGPDLIERWAAACGCEISLTVKKKKNEEL